MSEEADYLKSQFDYYENESHNKYFKNTRKPTNKGLYQCTLCKKYKPKTEFYKDNRVPCGIRNRCKECYHK